jgi:hypothetical protein
MNDILFGSIVDATATDLAQLALTCLTCTACALVLGCAFALVYGRMVRGVSRTLVTAIALLPAIVCVVIMMVDGSVGTGIAVAGAFSLVRFRSAPGSAREIVVIFAAMALGLICAMGMIGLAAIFTLAACVVILVGSTVARNALGGDELCLTITVPENLDFEGEFDDVLARYTARRDLSGVKTTNMGSLYKLSYDVTLLPDVRRKDLIDELRVRNGNLEISLHKQEVGYEL